jgi:hypothetical protein
MEPTALSFNSLLNRLRLLGATVVTSPPAPEGWVWLFGMNKGIVPFLRGPMYPIKDRSGVEIIPGRMISKILRRLSLDSSQQLQFWSIEEHTQYRSAASTQ